MSGLENRFWIFKKISLQAAGSLLLILLALALLWFNHVNSNQAMSAMAADVYFEGEYRIGDGPWQNMVPGEHIPAVKGDVTLKGNFHLLDPEGGYAGIFDGGVPLAFYTDHIHVSFRYGENEIHAMDYENPLFGSSACGEGWTAYSFTEGSTEPVEIIIHNPHRFGNERAVDELLDNVAIWGTMDFEREILESGKMQRNTGLLFVVIALVVLGSALFSALIHLQNTKIMWMFGLTTLFAGGYFAYSAPGVSFWSESTANNTAILGICMMFYMLFVSGIITYFLQNSKKIGLITAIALGILDGVCFVIPMTADIYFYDTWPIWVIGQTAANLLLFTCVITEYMSADRKARWMYGGMALLLAAFELDAAATVYGAWKGGLISKYAFAALLVAVLFVILRIIPESINAAMKAKELELQRSRLEAEKNMIEAELKDSRVSIMLSQIQPHFIYNTLGTIERMCLKDPQKAFNLVRNFSLYLRGNFSELDSVAPIRFTDEMKHVEYYVNIEKVRFPDMNIEYHVEATDFVLPALSVQPLVENAIKHGLMRLETGGTVLIRSYETPTHFCVEVKDDGVGFDTSLPIDEKKHVGLRNIRGRLQAMVDGELMIESAPEKGTRAVIMIPKEVNL